MKLRNLTTVIIACITFGVQAQNIPAARQVEWDIAGIPGGIPCPSDEVDATNNSYGQEMSTGDSDNSGELQWLLENASETVIYIPNGTYDFQNTIDVPAGKVIRGESSANTILDFNLSNGQLCFEIFGGLSGFSTTASASVSKGGNTMDVNDASGFSVGDDVMMEQDNNGAIETDPASWSDHIRGQMLVITNISGNTLTFDRTFTLDYNTSDQITLYKANLLKNVGFENFRINRVDNNNGTGNSTFYFYLTANCWIKCLHSNETGRYHVYLEDSRNIEIRGSYFDDAKDHGGGGNGYGVLCQDHVGECLIENNVFRRLRHSLIVKEGASRNVYGYNYSREATWDISGIPADISIHGHYPYYNLFESNIVQRITSTDAWGRGGPGNTFFRNRIEGEKDVWTQNNTDYQNFVGNEITNTTSGGFRIDDNRDGSGVNGTLLLENYESATGTIDNTGSTPINSYYLSAKPSFFGADPWPSIGSGSGFAPGAGTIPAEERWNNYQSSSNLSDLFVDCGCTPTVICETPDLGADFTICGASLPVTLDANVSSTNSTFTWTRNGSGVGGNSATLDINQAGTYVVERDSAGCVTSDEIIVSNVITTPDLGPDVNLCSPAFVDLDAGVSGSGLTYQWNKDGSPIAGATSRTLDFVRTPGTYEVVVSGSPCTSQSDQVVITSDNPTPIDDCASTGPASLNLGITNATGGPYEWYDDPSGGSALTTGTSYNPTLSSTDTFYVQNTAATAAYAGKTARSTDGFYTNTYKLIFDVETALTIDSITVYSENAQTLTITIRDNGGANAGDRTMAVSAGENRIYLGLGLAVGNDYSMEFSGSSDLWLDNELSGTVNFPYEIPGLIRINDIDPAWVLGKPWYPFFYNWRVSTGGTACSRLPVVGMIGSCSVLPVDFTRVQLQNRDNGIAVGWQTISEDNTERFVVERSSDGKHFTTVGEVPATGNSNMLVTYDFVDHYYPNTVAYYRVVAIDFDGLRTVSQVKSITASEEEWQIYPNPAGEQMTITCGGPFEYAIQSATGMMVKRGRGSEKVNLNIKGLAAGIYFVSLKTGNNEMLYKKLVVE